MVCSTALQEIKNTSLAYVHMPFYRFNFVWYLWRFCKLSLWLRCLLELEFDHNYYMHKTGIMYWKWMWFHILKRCERDFSWLSASRCLCVSLFIINSQYILGRKRPWTVSFPFPMLKNVTSSKWCDCKSFMIQLSYTVSHWGFAYFGMGKLQFILIVAIKQTRIKLHFRSWFVNEPQLVQTKVSQIWM